jgi:Domain of unknown function (DUF4440)
MNTCRSEVAVLKERLRMAELGPDSQFFEEALADDAVLVSQDGQYLSKQRIVEAYRPGQGPKFSRVEMGDMRINDHDTAVVVTCKGAYEGPQFSGISSCACG